MPVDINVITQELSNLLTSVYSLQRNLYDLYLDDTPKQVQIDYIDINNATVSVLIDNVALLNSKFNSIEDKLIQRTSYINILKNVQLNGIANWTFNSNNITYTYSTQDLTTDDKVAISTIIGYDIFSPPNALQPTYKKLVCSISTPGNRQDLKFGQSATDIGLNIWHPNSFKMQAFINPNGTGWTNDITPYIANPKTSGFPFELAFGDLYLVEIFYPVLYPVYNKGLVPSLL